LGDNQLKDVFVRFKELADRKKEIYEDDLIALMRTSTDPEEDRVKLVSMQVVCGTMGPQKADMVLSVDGQEHSTSQTGDGPVDAAFNCVKALVPHNARLQLYQVHAVTEGTDAQIPIRLSLRPAPTSMRSTACWCAAKRAAPTSAKSATKT
jgi:2-isopropylmalate synthase